MFFKLNNAQCLHSGDHMKELDDAPDKPPTIMVTVIVVLSFLFVFAVVALSFPITEKLAEKRENEINNGMGNPERMAYLASQKQITSSYKKLDDGHYQVPIQQAMKMIINTQGDMSSFEDENK